MEILKYFDIYKKIQILIFFLRIKKTMRPKKEKNAK